MAMSRDALNVRFYVGRPAGDSLVISPDDKAGFTAELARQNPHLELSGEGLIKV